jgi:hypothetical protein
MLFSSSNAEMNSFPSSHVLPALQYARPCSRLASAPRLLLVRSQVLLRARKDQKVRHVTLHAYVGTRDFGSDGLHCEARGREVVVEADQVQVLMRDVDRFWKCSLFIFRRSVI